MKRFLKSLMLLLCSSFFAMTGWAAGESISIGFNHARTEDNSKFTGETLYGWTGAQVAGNHWNHIESGINDPLDNVSVTGLKLNSGEKVTATIKNLSTQGSWMHYGPAQLNGGTRDYYDGQITFTLEDIPFSEYTVVLFMATNNDGKTWGAVKVTSDAEDEGKFYTYVDGVLSAEGTEGSTWGNSSSLTENYTATEGTNVMVIPNLSGDKTFLTYGTSGGAATRGGLYAIQIINTGALTIPEPMWTWDGTKADGSMCTQLDRLPFGTSYTVNNRIFDLNDLNIPAKNFTYSFWTMRDGPGNWRDYGGFSNSSGLIQIQRDDKGSTVHIYPDGGATLASGDMAFPLAINSYNLVTCVQDSGTFKIYVNGELAATDTLNNWASLTDANATMRWFALGEAPNKSGGSFGRNGDARIADARIYSAALTAEQVQMLYKASIADMPEVIQNATAHYEFEGTSYGLRGNLSLTSEAPSASDCVETLRKYPEGVVSAGEFRKGIKIRSGVSPHNNYQWANEFTVAAYVNLTDCPDNGTICSFRDSYWLQKISATELRFGKNNEEESVKASLTDLSVGYHLVVVTKTADTITIQIDNNEPVSKSVALNSPNGIQLGTGWASSAARATGMILDGFTLWEKVLTSEEVTELSTYYPELYPALSMAADTDGSGALSWDEITAVLGNRTTWDISGEVKISLDADVDPALTALTLLPANASGDSLTITGTGSLWAADVAFALTTDIPVDVTNIKNNPRITLSGTGDVTIRKPTTGGGGIVPAFDGYTGVLTVDDGQQITRMSDELTIPFTVGEGGAKLHANDGRWHVASKISGSGPLVVVGPSGSGTEDRIVVFSNNETDHTGPVTIESGRVRLGSNSGWDNPGADTAFGDQTTITVKEGAMCRLHYGYTNQTNASFVFEGNTTFGNVDGNAVLNGSITIRGSAEKPVAFPFHWDKTLTVNGKLSGEGTLVFANPSKGNWGGWTLTNNANDFTGTIKLGGNRTRLTLNEGAFATGHVEFGAAGELVLNADNTIAGLSGTAGTVKSNDSTVRTLTLNGNSDVRNVTFENVNLVIASGETFVNANTAAIANDGTIVKVVLTADEMLSGVEAKTVPATDATVTYVFLASDGKTVLQSGNSSSYEALQECEYDVAEGKWSDAREPSSGGFVTIDFGGTESKIVDLAEILTSVTALEQLVVLGSYGGTITSSALIPCQSLDVQTDVELPIELVNSCSTLSVVDDKILTINVAQEATLNKALSGNYAVKKSGAGTLTLGANVNVDDGVEILAGTLKFGNGVIPYKTGTYPTTNAGNVKVHTDATLDVNGNGDAFLNMVTLCDGATYANSSSTALGNNTRQLKGITLEGDATVHASANFGILAGGHAASTLDLGGYTLTKTGSGAFWLSNTAVGNGTLKVDGGKFEKLNTPTFNNVTFDSNLDTAFILGTGAVTAPVTKKGTGAMTIGGVISGEGAVNVMAGNLTLASANTYAGGTDIAANATLTITNAGALGSSVITGAGTLKFSGLVPTNLSGLTTGTAASDETPASGWTGTFYMMNRASAGQFPVNDWGNANSTVCLESCSGYLAPSTGVTIVPNIRLEGYGWRSQNGDQNGGQFIFTGALSGSGKLEVAGNPEVGNFYKFTGNVSGFTGYVNVEGNHRIVFGDAESQGNGKITIATDVTIASGKTWTAVNGIVITENVTLTISEAIALPTDKAVSGAGTLVINGTVDLSGITGALTCALTAADGATVTVTEAQLAAFAKITIPETATLIVKVDRPMSDHLTGCTYDITAGAGSTIDGSITVNGIAGTGTFSNGTLSIVAPANPTLTGNAWWWDYEFNGSATSIGSDTDSMTLESTNQKSYTEAVDGNQELYFQQTPYRGASFDSQDAFTAVMYCQPGENNNTALIGFGSTTATGKTSVVLATGANAADGEMQIVLIRPKASGGGFEKIQLAGNLTVPNATEKMHLYAFTFDAQADKTVISVYVDGKLKKTTTVNERFHVSNGFQIGSIHGGVDEQNRTGDTGLEKYPSSGDSGTLDFLRVTKGVLSADAMRALAEAYPYHSEKGTAARTVADTTANWVADDTWSQAMPNAEAVQQAAPNNGTNVTLTANVETAVTVNLTEAVTYETVTVAGNTAVTFKKGGTATFKAGDITIGTDVTIEYGAVDVDTLIVNGGKTLTFDFTDYDFNSIYASKTLPLTGLATLGENATVTVELPTLPAYLTAECVFDASKSEYALAITVTGTLAAEISQNCTWDEVTWKIGVIEVDCPADLSAFASIPVVLTQDATLTLESAVTLNAVTVSGGALTLAGAKLTATSLTMDNADVVATPDTLDVSAVIGSTKDDSLTMDVGEGTVERAMSLSNCAFTKAGEGTLTLAKDGIELNAVDVTLDGGELKLSTNNGDAQVENSQFIYAGGTLTSHGWVRSASKITFDVPAGIDAVAFSGNNLTEPSNVGDEKCYVEKTGEGSLTLYLKNAPYAGTTTVSEGTMAYAGLTCTLQGTVSVAANAAIKGSSNCTFASLSFANGAVIDATNGPVVATDVTLPETGTVTVRMTNHGEVLKATGLDNVEKFVVETPVTNCNLMLTENGLAYVAAPATGDVEFSAEVQEMLNVMAQAAAGREGITSLTIEGITLAMDGEGNPVKADIAGLELFERVPVLVVPDGENGTGVAMVNYVFGISDITVDGDGYIVVKASVDRLAMDNPVEPIEGEDAGEGEGEMSELQRPTFVNGVVVELLNNGESIGTETVNLVNMDNASEITITSDDTVAEILNGATGTLDLTVKVKSAQASKTPEGDEEEVTPAE